MKFMNVDVSSPALSTKHSYRTLGDCSKFDDVTEFKGISAALVED